MRKLATLVLVAAFVAAGCSDQGLPPPMTIVNRTDQPVVVTIVNEADEYEELPMTLPGGGGMGLLAGPFHGSEPCMRGGLVATQDGRTIAVNDRPCPGSRWEIVAPSSVSSPSA